MTLLRAFCKVCTRASASWQSWVTRWCSLSLLKRSSSASFTWKQQHVKWKTLNQIYSHIFLYHTYKYLTKIQYQITTVNNQYQVDLNSKRKCNNINLSSVWMPFLLDNAFSETFTVNFICIFALLVFISYSIGGDHRPLLYDWQTTTDWPKNIKIETAETKTPIAWMPLR